MILFITKAVLLDIGLSIAERHKRAYILKSCSIYMFMGIQIDYIHCKAE